MKYVKLCSVLLAIFLTFNYVIANQPDLTKPIVTKDVVFNETNGVAVVEAEHFYKQSEHNVRAWYITAKDKWARPGRDADGPHCVNASNNAYIEVLPDTRVTHADKLIDFENFSNAAGKMCIVHYKVNINTPGRYYVWVRAYSTGSEDNGIHVGINGDWPESGQRMQWCAGKHSWRWESKQRTQKDHCGEAWKIYLDIDKKGVHDIQFSMREDGFEFDKFILANDTSFNPRKNDIPSVALKNGTLPDAFPVVKEDPVLVLPFVDKVEKAMPGIKLLKAVTFPVEENNFYINNNWLAINPNQHKEAKTSKNFNGKPGTYDIVFMAVGENDGKSEYKVWVDNKEIGRFIVPLSRASFEEGADYCELWENIELKKGSKVEVFAKTGSSDGNEYSRGRWSGVAIVPMTKGKDLLEAMKNFKSVQSVNTQASKKTEQRLKEPELKFSNINERGKNGNGKVEVSGELKQWHKVTLTLGGPFAHELDKTHNPFTDYNMEVTFIHESGTPIYKVPGYFAADGNAANTSADKGNKWRAHLSPDKTGKWNYSVSFKKGVMAAILDVPWANNLKPYHGVKGEFVIADSDKNSSDFRSKGRLEYVRKHHLQFKSSGEYFLKAGPDAPETFLAYEDFDATYTVKAKTPIKKYKKHLPDWKNGDPTWMNGKGKGIIGAVNYLSSKGVNAISFLTYAAGGDGDNLWPFVSRDRKFHYDCSKLDQWGIVFDHAQAKGLYLHFKTQETENDDNRRGKNKNAVVPTSLDNGDLGPERRLYYRELIARYAYHLALNWNLGEENTQSKEQQQAMAKYFKDNCPYNHNIVIHTFPGQQDRVYWKLLGDASEITGASLQNQWDDVHHRTLQWVKASHNAGKPWVVANDEQGSAGTGVPPDPGYEGFNADRLGYNLHDIRKQTLWGNLMAGGAGVEYYFGYKLPENDLLCEDYRSRDKSWDYCRIALNFFKEHNIPFWEMKNENILINNKEGNKEKFCFAKRGKLYLVYLGYAETSTLNLAKTEGTFTVEWFNPRIGGKLKKGSVKEVKGGKTIELGNAPSDKNEDWLVVIRKK